MTSMIVRTSSIVDTPSVRYTIKLTTAANETKIRNRRLLIARKETASNQWRHNPNESELLNIPHTVDNRPQVNLSRNKLQLHLPVGSSLTSANFLLTSFVPSTGSNHPR